MVAVQATLSQSRFWRVGLHCWSIRCWQVESSFCLAGLQKAVMGRTRCLGYDLAALDPISRRRFRRRSVHLVPQSAQLCPQFDALDNVLFAQRLQGKASVASCREILHKLALEDRLHHLPSQLSIGEKQRVCVARGLVTGVPLLLIDEPTSNLDDNSVLVLVDLFRDAATSGRSLLVVSNDSRLSQSADRTVTLTPSST